MSVTFVSFVEKEGSAPFGKRIILLKRSAIIARETSTCGMRDDNLVFANRIISKCHAELSLQHHQVFIKDLSSTNGTFLNDVPLPSNGAAALIHNNDVLQLGKAPKQSPNGPLPIIARVNVWNAQMDEGGESAATHEELLSALASQFSSHGALSPPQELNLDTLFLRCSFWNDLVGRVDALLNRSPIPNSGAPCEASPSCGAVGSHSREPPPSPHANCGAAFFRACAGVETRPRHPARHPPPDAEFSRWLEELSLEGAAPAAATTQLAQQIPILCRCIIDLCGSTVYTPEQLRQKHLLGLSFLSLSLDNAVEPTRILTSGMRRCLLRITRLSSRERSRCVASCTSEADLYEPEPHRSRGGEASKPPTTEDDKAAAPPSAQPQKLCGLRRAADEGLSAALQLQQLFGGRTRSDESEPMAALLPVKIRTHKLAPPKELPRRPEATPGRRRPGGENGRSALGTTPIVMLAAVVTFVTLVLLFLLY